jgi:hypothetical protein
LVRAERFDDPVRAYSEIVFALFELKTAAGTEQDWIEREQEQKYREVHAGSLTGHFRTCTDDD